MFTAKAISLFLIQIFIKITTCLLFWVVRISHFQMFASNCNIFALVDMLTKTRFVSQQIKYLYPGQVYLLQQKRYKIRMSSVLAEVKDSVAAGNPGDTLKVYGFPRVGNVISSASPFTEKLETYLKMNSIKYEGQVGRSYKSPKGKMPYIEQGDVTLSDTTFIVQYLENTYGDQVQIRRSDNPQLFAKAAAVERVMEDHVYWGGVYFRWIPDKTFQQVSAAFFAGMPFFVKPFIVPGLRKQVVENVKAQGIGRHSEKDILHLMDTSLKTVSTMLGDGMYITGEKAVPEDASMFAVLDNYLNDGFNTPMKQAIEKYPNLVNYVSRIRKDVFADKQTDTFVSKYADK
eukprot:TRINITY_DN9847_c0_g1_i7.p1 TRINITY_DN9847_c0_g1~~TRINITY_DN9847_c0_g1_i7.p1  ORF type:complete len:345 (-),score=35.21 TRINITY_DN9847_c0_g1_i7:783-1817(-)